MSGREIFEELRSSGFAVIERWVGEAREESVHLEFKGRARDRSKGQQAAPKDRLDKIDKAVLARAISGLANSDGGVVVLGLDCPQGGGLLPNQSYLARPAEVARDFQSISKDITTPAVPGLDVLPVAGPDGRGVVAVHAPASGVGPHRANAGDDRYYLRTTDNTVVMPHHVLAALFGREPKPRLALSVVVDNANQGPPRIQVFLANHGRSVARMPCVAFEPVHGLEFSSDARNWSSSASVSRRVFEWLEFLRPGEDRFVGAIDVRRPRPDGEASWMVELAGELLEERSPPARFVATVLIAEGHRQEVSTVG